MNKTFRLVWSQARNAWIVTHEHAATHGKPSSTRKAAVASALVLGMAAAWAGGPATGVAPPKPTLVAVAVNALPTGGQLVGGPTAGSINVNGNAMTVTQNQQRLIANWDTFNIGSGASVNFVQPSSSAIALNRVLGQDPSQILGKLSANGQVMLINPSGIVFGQSGQVNTGGLVASTLSLSDANFMAGKYSFAADPASATAPGSIVNQGHITTPNGGVVALIAPVVQNEGSISTPQGSTLLAAGNAVDVDFAGDGLITYRINAGAADALADNSGKLSANGGLVVLSAQSADALTQAVVNNSGVISAQSLQNHGGRIVLDGGSSAATAAATSNTGSLNASGAANAQGGSIELSGGFVALGGTLNADGASGGHISVASQGALSLADQVHAKGLVGDGGSVSYTAAGRLIENDGSHTDVSGQHNGGGISVSANRVFSSGTYVADGATGQGGRIDLTAKQDVNLFSAHLSAKGSTQGGLIRVGGPFQGDKAADANTPDLDRYVSRWGTLPTLGHAQKTLVNDSATLDVSAAQGEGGTAIVWSDLQTTMLGHITATGSTRGGVVEISSAEELRRTDLLSVNIGSGGRLLLDPKNITIGTASTASGWAYAGILGLGYNDGSKNSNNGALQAGVMFGSAVALNAAGDRLAVGAWQDGGSGYVAAASGAVYLFSFSDTSFSGGTLQATLGKGYSGGKNVNVGALEANDFFGRAVALNAAGDRLAVGASQDFGAGNLASASGAVYLFSFSDTSFSGGTLQATLGKGYAGGKNINVSALEAMDYFGGSVALNAAGDRLAVGAYQDAGSGNAASNSGAVYLFSFSDTSFTGGALQATLGKGYTGGKNVNVTALEAYDNFGWSVALNAVGDCLAVGASADSGSGNVALYSGAVYLFSFSDTSFTGGTLQATLGKGYSGGKNIDVGSLEASDRFGSAVSLNATGDRLAVGAYQDAGSGNVASQSGAVYLFSFSDTSFTGGTLQATLGKGYGGGKNVNVSSLEANDYFGFAVSLNAAGDRLAVGAYGDAGAGNASGSYTGAVYLFSFSDTSFTGGTLQATLGKGYTSGSNVNVSALEAWDMFGTSVALNAAGDRLAVGAYGDTGFGNVASNSGAVYLFSFSDTNFSGGTLQATLGKGYTGGKNVDVSALEANDNFGWAVALNATGDRLAVGAYQDAGSGNAASNSGGVYLFSFSDTSFAGGALQATLGKGYTGGKNINVSALEASDWFGGSVALNAAGDRLAVGAWGDAGSGNLASQSGAVYLFSFSDTNFSGGTLQATLGNGYSGGKNVNVSAVEGGDRFGSSVALNAAGDRLAVGASSDKGSGNLVNGSGAVYLFSFSDTSFTGGALQATLGSGYTGGNNVNVSALNNYDQFGQSVALNAAGDRLAVGASADSGPVDATTASGAVYLFSFTGTSFTGGTLQATLGKGYGGGKNVNVSAVEANDYFGNSVALNAAGDRLAVGAFRDGGAGNSATASGAVYLFSFSDTSFSGGALQATMGAGYTTSKNSVSVGALAANDQFGTSVALNAAGDRLAVGAFQDDGFGNAVGNSGAVYLFSFSDTSFSGGTLQATLGKGYSGGKNVNVSALEASDSFGSSVSLNAAGDRLAVGAYNDAGFGNVANGSGAVYLFSFSDTNFSGGTLQATLGKGYTGGKNVDVSALINFDQFGLSVALNAAGDRLAVGAYNDAGFGNVANGSGAVYLFSFSDTNFSGGTLQATLGKGYTGGKNVDVSALEAGDNFGWAVALNATGDRLAVGAYTDGGSGNLALTSGAVYLFSFSDTSFTGGTLQATLGRGYSGGKNVGVAALENGDQFGSSVSLNAMGDKLAVGAWKDGGSGNLASSSGAVYLFGFSDTNFTGGSLLTTLGKGYTGGTNVNVGALEAGDNFGASVSLNAAGDRLAVGAYGDAGSGNVASASGAVYLFTMSSAGNPASDGASYANLASSAITVTPADLTTLLNAGTAVTLQASNDITVNLAVAANNPSGNGGALSLSAGRSLLINANISTDSGNLNLTANDTAAHGVVDAQRDAGAAVITMASGTSLNAGTGAVNIQLLNGAGNTNATSGEITLRDVTAGSISAVNSGGTGGVTLASGALNASGTGKAIVLAGQDFVNNAGAAALSTANGNWLVYSASPGATTKGGETSAFRHYGGTYTSYAPGSVTESASSGSGGFIYASAAGALSVATTLANGTASSTYGDAPTATYGTTLSGFADSEDNASNIGLGGTATFSNAPTASTNAGSLTVGYNTGLSSTAGYTFTAGTGLGYTVNKRTVTLSGSKTYDASTSLTGAVTLGNLVSGQALTYTGATVNDKNVATASKYVSAITLANGTGGLAANYQLPTLNAANAPVTISAKALTESGLSVAASRVYNGSTSATLSGTAALQTAEAAGAGTTADGKPYTGDTVSLTGTAVGTYNSKDVATASTVSYSGLSLTGGQAGNYTLTMQGSSAATITPKTVGVSAAKTYDASTDLTGHVTLSTGVGSETLAYTGATASDAHVATSGKYVNAITLADGTNGGVAGNYQLPALDAAHAPVTINAKTLTETLTNTGTTKVYDGNTDAPAGFTPTWSFSGFVAGDTDAALSSTGVAYNSKNVVSASTITESGLAITGITGSHSSAASDYQLATSSASANAAITTKTVTVSAAKTYDGSTSLTGAVSIGTGVGSETLTYSGATVNDKNVATASKYVSAITLADASDSSGGLASNYQLPTLDATHAPATITTKALTESGLSVATSKVYDATTDVTLLGSAALQATEAAGAGTTGDGKPYSVDTVSLSGTPVGTYNSKDVATATTVTYSGLSLTGAGADNYTLTLQGNSAATITPKPLTQSGLSVAASRVYNGTTAATVLGTAMLQADESAGSGSTADGKSYTGDVVNLSGTPVGTYDHKDVATASTVTYSGLSLSGGQAGNYTLTTQSPSVATITPKTVGVSAAKTYDASTDLTGHVTLTTGVGSETLSYTGATASDAHVATSGKYVDAITLADGTNGGVAGNYQLPTLDAAHAPVTINAKTLTETLSNTGVTKVYDGNTDAPAGFTPSWNITGFVSGDSDATLASTATAYNSKDVSTASSLTVSGLSIGSITGGNASAASDYQLATSSGSASAAITPKTVTVSASKTYDGSTSLTGAVTLGGYVGSETLGYSGATANDAHVATSGKYVNAITLADASDSSGGLASNYQLPTLDATHAPVTIGTRTLTETLTNTGVTKVYDGSTDAPTGFAPSWNVMGFAPGDTAATLSSTGAAYNSKDVVSATGVTVSGVAITGISGGNTSASSDYQLATTSPSVAAAITPKDISLSASKTYDSSTDLTGKVTLGNLVGSETLAYSGATANDKNVLTTSKYVNAITLVDATDGSGGLASNYQLPSLAAASADNQVGISAKTATVAGSTGVTKTYDALTSMPVGNAGHGDAQGLVTGDAVTLAGVPVFDSANAGGRVVQQGSLALSGGDASNYHLVWTDGNGVINKAPLTVSANADAKFVTQADAAGYNGVSYNGFVHGETAAVLNGSVSITRTGGDTLAGSYTGVLVPAGLSAGNYEIAYANGNYTIVPADQLLVRVQNTNTTYGTNAAYNITSAQYLDGSNVIHTLSAPTVSGNTYTYSDGAGGTAQFTLGAVAPQTGNAGQLVVGNYAVGASNVAETSVNFSNHLVVVGNLAVDQKALTATATNVSKVYDGNTSMAGVSLGMTGLETGDTVTVNGVGNFAQKNAGNHLDYTVAVQGISGLDAGNYYLTQGAQFSGNDGAITPKTVAISAGRVYDGSNALGAGTVAIATGVGNETLSYSGAAAHSKNVGNGNFVSAVTLVDAADGSGGLAANYQLPSLSAASADNTVAITPKALTVSGITAANKVYDGSAVASVSSSAAQLAGLVGGDDLSVSATGLFDSKNAANGKTVTLTSSHSGVDVNNYAITDQASTTADVTPKALTVSGITAANKVYDGNAVASVSTGAAQLAGLVSGDELNVSATGLFDSKNVGTGKTVTLTSSHSGADVNNYAITDQATTVADVTPKALTVSGITAANKVYNGNVAASVSTGAVQLAGLVSGDELNVSATGLFDSKNVGTGKTVTLTSSHSGADVNNYAITDQASTTADVTPKALTVSGITAANKVYDGNAVASVSTANAAYSGLVSGDDLSVTATGQFDSKNAGTNKTVTLTSSHSGADVNNYAITDQAATVADVTPKALTVSGITAANKVYDGNAVASVSTGAVQLAGLVAGDELSVSATGLFDSKNAANGKTVTLTSSHSGADVNNYAITDQASTTADVTPKALTVSGITAANKVYDGNAVASVSTANAAYSGLVSGDDLSVAATGQFDSKNAGTNKTVTLTSRHSGADVNNYAITDQASTRADITPKDVTVSGTTAANKLFDGNTTAALSLGTLSGFVGTETLVLGGSGNFDTPDPGTAKTVTVAHTLADGTNGGLASNYQLTNATTTTTANITSPMVVPTPPTSPTSPTGTPTTDGSPSGGTPSTGGSPATGGTPLIDTTGGGSSNPGGTGTSTPSPDGGTGTPTTNPNGGTTTTNPDGGTSTTTPNPNGGSTTTTANPDGSSSTSTTKPNPNGGSTTETTTRNADGSTSTSTTVTSANGGSTTTTTNSDGSSSTSTTKPNPNGGSTTETTTRNADGSTSTSTTVTSANGGSTTTTTNSDGSSSTSTTKPNPNGGSTTETTTRNADGTTSTSTTVTNGNGGSTTTTVNSDGSSSTSTTKPNPNGGSTTETTTRNADGTTSTSTTVTNGNGGSTTTTVNSDGSSSTSTTKPNPNGGSTTETTTRNADGTTSTSTTVTSANGGSTTTTVYSDGGVSSKTTTPNSGGGSTTESTTVDPTGTSTTSKTVTDGKGGSITEVTTLNPDGSATSSKTVVSPDGTSATKSVGADGSVTSTEAGPGGTWCGVTYPDGTLSTTTFAADGSSATQVVYRDGGSVSSKVAADGSVSTTTKGSDGQITTTRTDQRDVEALPVQQAVVKLTLAQIDIGNEDGILLLEALRTEYPDVVAVLAVNGKGGLPLPATLKYATATGRLKIAGKTTWQPFYVLAVDRSGQLKRFDVQLKKLARK